MQFKVYGNRIVYEGSSYFVRSASSALLGAWGQKRTPIAAQNYIDVEDVFGDAPPNQVPFHETSQFEADFDSSFRLNHVGAMNLPFKLFNLGIDDATSYNMLRNGQCKFRRRYLHSRDVVDAINGNSALIDILKQDNDYRIVTSVIWLESCTITSSKTHDVDVDGDFSLGRGGGDDADDGELAVRPAGTGLKGVGSKGRNAGKGVKISIVGDDSTSITRNLTFSYGSDSVMAYGLHKFEWDKTNKKKREQITGAKADWQGVN